MTSRSKSTAILLLCLAGVVHAQGPSSVPSIETILTGMADARAENRSHLRSYKVTRSYQLFGPGEEARAEVLADVTFVPPDLKRFSIRHSNGIGLATRIVRQMLEHEVDMVKNFHSTDLTEANYVFRFVRTEKLDGRFCFVLEMIPRRKDKILLQGHIWVGAETYRLLRTEGKPGKAPSWLLRDSSIALVYGDVGGMWLQTSSESKASVRILGEHKMRSRDLEYEFGDLTAGSQPDRLSSRERGHQP